MPTTLVAPSVSILCSFLIIQLELVVVRNLSILVVSFFFSVYPIALLREQTDAYDTPLKLLNNVEFDL